MVGTLLGWILDHHDSDRGDNLETRKPEPTQREIDIAIQHLQKQREEERAKRHKPSPEMPLETQRDLEIQKQWHAQWRKHYGLENNPAIAGI